MNRTLNWTVREIARMSDEISANPESPIAYCLIDILDASSYLLKKSSEVLSVQMRESLLDSLKLGIIACFQAYPRLSQSSTESIAGVIAKSIDKLADEKDVFAVLEEACELFDLYFA